MEKVDIVKRLIRANNYEQCDRTFEQCVELGIQVNRVALGRFAAKLELIDKAERQRNRRNASKPQAQAKPQTTRAPSQRQPAAKPTTSLRYEQASNLEIAASPAQQQSAEAPRSQPREVVSNAELNMALQQDALAEMPQVIESALNELKANAPSMPVLPEEMTYEQVKQREAEITFELGSMKIREHALLQELNALSEKLGGNRH